MRLQKHALDAANVADKLSYTSRVKTIGGQNVLIVPYDEAMTIKDQLVAISHVLNDIADREGGSDTGAEK